MGRTVRSIIRIMSHYNNAAVLKYRLGIDLDREFTDEELDSDKSILLNNLLEPHTRAETAEKFGITRERVIAIERAFFHNGCSIGRRKPSDYLE